MIALGKGAFGEIGWKGGEAREGLRRGGEAYSCGSIDQQSEWGRVVSAGRARIRKKCYLPKNIKKILQ